jgi:hypothetical protein
MSTGEDLDTPPSVMLSKLNAKLAIKRQLELTLSKKGVERI